MDDLLQPAIDTLNGFLTSFIALLPSLIAALIIMILGLAASRMAERSAREALVRFGRPQNTAIVLARLVRYLVVIGVIFLALTVALPDLTPASILTGLGFTGVAVGFAFRDILQNFLAGILILLTEPFRLGDQIVASGYEGVVEDIQIRATILRTYDNRQVVIPNADIYTKEVVVNTAYPQRRSQYDVGIGYGDDIDRAKRAIMAAIRTIPGVSSDPGPDILMVDLADSSVVMRVRWWTNSFQGEALGVQDRVIERIKHTLDIEGIDIPYPTQTMLMRDQTTGGSEARSKQDDSSSE